MEAATLSLVRDNQPSSCSESPPVRTCHPEGTSTVSAPVETLIFLYASLSLASSSDEGVWSSEMEEEELVLSSAVSSGGSDGSSEVEGLSTCSCEPCCSEEQAAAEAKMAARNAYKKTSPFFLLLSVC